MRLYEYEAKKVFEKAGLITPECFGVIESKKDLENINIKYPVILKSQVLVGGRGKQGGILKAANEKEVNVLTEKLLGLTISNYPVTKIMLEEIVDIKGSCYIGVTMNPSNYNNILMASAEGGVEIETVAKENPDAIYRNEITDNSYTLSEDIAKECAEFLNKKYKKDKKFEKDLAGVITKLYNLYQANECKVAEINPLVITDSEPIAADAKIVLDDNGLFRQLELLEYLGIKEKKRHDVSEASKNEKRAADTGYPYVDLLEENFKKEEDKLYVGLVPGGAGYGIFSIDQTANIGDKFFNGKVVPINFMDSGGGPSEAKVAEMFHMLMDNDLVDIIITSRFGGISSCDVFIRGLIRCFFERKKQGRRIIPVYGRMVGTDLPSAKTYLEKSKKEYAKELELLDIVVGNKMIMAEVIRQSIEKGFEFKRSCRI